MRVTKQAGSAIYHIITSSITHTEFKSGSDQSIGTFKLRLRDINWSKVTQCGNANDAYTIF